MVIARPPDYVVQGGRYNPKWEEPRYHPEYGISRVPGLWISPISRRLGEVPETYRPKGVNYPSQEPLWHMIIPKTTKEKLWTIISPLTYIGYKEFEWEKKEATRVVSETKEKLKDTITETVERIKRGGEEFVHRTEEFLKEHDIGGKLEGLGAFIIILLILIILAKR